jgi:hypothetical protein
VSAMRAIVDILWAISLFGVVYFYLLIAGTL